MPSRPMTLIERTRRKHPMRRFKTRRATASERGYGSSWRKVSNDYLSRHPLCVRCGRPSEHTDHVLAKRDGGTDDESNLQALCFLCHNSKRTWAGGW